MRVSCSCGLFYHFHFYHATDRSLESPHFSKPTAAFIGDALFGTQASGEVKLASWVKLLNCRAKPKKADRERDEMRFKYLSEKYA